MSEKDIVELPAKAEDDPRRCTCHPNDDPPRPCPRKYALTDCRIAHLARVLGTQVSTTEAIAAEAATTIDRLRSSIDRAHNEAIKEAVKNIRGRALDAKACEAGHRSRREDVSASRWELAAGELFRAEEAIAALARPEKMDADA